MAKKYNKYLIMDKLYSQEDLDEVSKDIKVRENDMILIERLGDAINTNMLSEDELAEIIFYSVLTSDPQDPKFIMEHPELCDRCGWCCSEIKNIEVRRKDIERIGSFNNIEPKGEHFNMITPCVYLSEYKTCKIYNKRPDSCKSYPLAMKNGKIIVQRNLECGFIYNFLLNKITGFVREVTNNANK